MNDTFKNFLRDATRLTQTGRLTEATAAIQRALGRGGRAQPAASGPEAQADVLDGCVFETTEPGRHSAAPEPAGQESFRSGSHTHAGLTRHFKLYVPPQAGGQTPLPLVVMLHGCTQDPDDFAAGTDMNARAREQGFYVLYPAQAQDANPSRCWNWFKHNHQTRGRGETGLIASMTEAVAAAHGVDRRRVYIAGLSAGGAMAALVAAAYPEFFAAVGVHSGLAPGAAGDLPQALAAMKGGSRATPAWGQLALPVIVFHGDADSTVHPRNGEQIIAGTVGNVALRPRIEQGVSAQGRRYTRSTHAGERGQAVAEHWLLHGAGHAWSGGRSAGSYTDAKGPDATGEMLRFFLANPRPAAH